MRTYTNLKLEAVTISYEIHVVPTKEDTNSLVTSTLFNLDRQVGIVNCALCMKQRKWF